MDKFEDEIFDEIDVYALEVRVGSLESMVGGFNNPQGRDETEVAAALAAAAAWKETLSEEKLLLERVKQSVG